MYDIIDGREQLDHHYDTVDDLWRSLTSLSAAKSRGDVSIMSNAKSSLGDKSGRDPYGYGYGAQAATLGSVSKKNFRI